MLDDKSLTRREFLGYTSAMGLSVAAAGALWSGRALADTPKRGGHMRCGLNDANTIRLARLHPVQRDDDDLHQPGHPGQHRRRRHRRPAGPEPCGKLGSHPRRQGLALQDPQGRRVLEREDPDHGRLVVNSINVHRGEDTKSAAKGVFAGISDVRVEGDDTVVVEVTDANADLPFLFTDYHFSVVPTVDGKADLHSPHGTGCYLLREFNPGVRTALEKNPNAWQGNELGFADSVEILAILDDTSRVNALVSDSVVDRDQPSRPEDHRAA